MNRAAWNLGEEDVYLPGKDRFSLSVASLSSIGIRFPKLGRFYSPLVSGL
jgi:hypothetical protein